MNGAGVGGYFMAGLGSVLKSLQTGTIDLNNVTSATATITAVVLANSILTLRGNTHNAALTNADVTLYRVELTNTTTVTVTRAAAEATAMPCGYTVSEMVTGVLKSSQSGTIQMNGGVTATATITAVVTAKSTVNHLGMSYNIAGSNDGRDDTLLTLTNTTTVTSDAKINPGASNLVSFQVPEYLV